MRERGFVHNETVRDVVAATGIAVSAFKRVCCTPLPVSSLDRVAGMVAEWFSAHLSVLLKEHFTFAER